MSKITIKLDIKKDAWNWWHACNKISYGVDWKMTIDKKLREKIAGKSQKEAYAFLLPYLEKKYKKSKIKDYIQRMQKGFSKAENRLFERMEKVTKHSIYRDKFTCFITSFPRFPYDYNKGYIWISNKKPLNYQLSIFIHELLHFQYFAYYGERVWNELGLEKYEDLKEAMTVISNEEFQDITLVKDEGYKIHQNLRKKLLKIWRKEKDMDRFIKQATQTLKYQKMVLLT